MTNALVHALGQQQSGGYVPGVVHTGISDTCSLEQYLPFVRVRMGADWTAITLAPHEVRVLPGRSRDHAFFELSSPMRLKRRHQLRRERDRAHTLV